MRTWPLALFLIAQSVLLAAEPATVEFTVRDAATKEPVPCRIHLVDENGQPVKPDGLTLPYWRDHFVCPGTATVALPAAGVFRYEIERGPEYSAIRKTLTAAAGETVRVGESLERIADLRREGWWSGETHVHRPLADVELLMRAEDLHVAVVITWWNDRNVWTDRDPPEQTIVRFDDDRLYDLLGGEDERGGGALLYSGLRARLPIAGSKREWPASSKFLAAGKQAGAWVDAEKPFWWDFPLWLSTGQLDSVGIANNHMHRGGVYNGEAWGRPRNREEFPEPRGNGLWSQTIYYHALNCGFRLPPSAGSASGVLPNPVGYNRMYALVDGDLTWEKYWSAVRAGRVFVTNGPLLRLTADGEPPGQVFSWDAPREVTLEGQLDARDPLAAIELVHNGRISRIEKLPARIRIDAGGWFLVRALADVPHTFRFASTAPWYVEIAGKKPQPDKASCEFFREWTDQRIDILRTTLTTDEERRDVLPAHEAARKFFVELPGRKEEN